MTNHFDSNGGEQNIAQGENAIGKQENVTQHVNGDGNIFSGTGNVTVNQNVLLKPRTVLLASALAAVLLDAGLASAPQPSKSATTAGDNAPAIVASGNVTVTYNNSVIPTQRIEELAGKLTVTESALANFFKIMEEQQVPLSDLDSKLREIAGHYKELLARVGTNQAAKQAIDAGNYAKAEELLEDIAKAKQHDSLAAAEANADNARLQRVQLRYDEAAKYWQKAAALLPENKKKTRASYLNSAGYDLKRIYNYEESLHLYEQSLAIYREIGDRIGEGKTLNNIGKIYQARRDYSTALTYLKQSLVIRQDSGDRAGDAITSYNIGRVYSKQDELVKAEQCLSRAVQLAEEISHPSLKKYRKYLERVRAKLRGK